MERTLTGTEGVSGAHDETHVAHEAGMVRKTGEES